MKKILFLISAMLFLTSSSFGQQAMTSDYLVGKYFAYTENPMPCHITALSYTEWKNKYNYIEKSNDIQLQYNSEGYLIRTKRIKSSGDYLNIAQKQRITGYAFTFAGVFIVCASPNKIGIIGIGTCSLIALICEASSIHNMTKTKRKVCLSQNGVAVKF